MMASRTCVDAVGVKAPLIVDVDPMRKTLSEGQIPKMITISSTLIESFWLIATLNGASHRSIW